MPTSHFKIALLLSYICIASSSAAILTPALPMIAHTFSLTHGALEWVVSIFLLGYVIGQLLYGPLAKRFSCLVALRCGLLLNLIGILMCILSTELSSYSLLLAGRLVSALGAASGLSCTFMLLNKLLSASQAKQAMSFSIVSFTCGIGISVTVGGIITQYFQWQDCFWVLLIHGVIMFLLTWQFQETQTDQHSLNVLNIVKSYMGALKSSQLIIYSLVAGLVSVFAYGYSATAPVYAHVRLHLSPSLYGYWNLINMIGMLGSGLLGAFLMKRYAAKKVLHIGLILTAWPLISLAILALSHTASAVWFFMTTMLLYLFSGILFPAASFLASNAIEDKACASSTMSFINMGSAMLGVIIIGYLPLSAIISFTTVFAVFFIIMLLLVHFRRDDECACLTGSLPAQG